MENETSKINKLTKRENLIFLIISIISFKLVGILFTLILFLLVVILYGKRNQILKIMKYGIQVCREHTNLIIVAVLLVGAFYWYEWRPIHIRSVCEKSAIVGAQEEYQRKNPYDQSKTLFNKEDYTLYYQMCTRGKGL